MIETLDKKDIFYIHKVNSLLLVIITFFVFLISTAYSALNSTLMVTGDLAYRAKSDIRITDVRINEVTNGGVEQYSPKYTKNTVSLGMKLPSLNSTVTYEVIIKNSSSDKYIISSITDKISGNPNISYTNNYTDTAIEANATITVLLTYKYNSSVTTLPSNLLKETTISFAFEKAGILLYDKIKKDYESGGKVKVYTGDKSTFIGDKAVYYYYGETLNNNVLFAGFCWRMYRTTETGGVKILYNGVPNSSGQCKNTRTASYAESSVFNTADSLAYAGYMYNKVYPYNYEIATNTRHLYGNSFTYSEGTYTLTDVFSANLKTDYASLTNKHYTCFNTSGTCTTLSYVYYLNNSATAYVYYIDLTGGASIEQALNEMLYDDNVNTTNSPLKTSIDTWYKNNMTRYTNYLEDTIWCNDRSMNNQSANGWNPNGGSMLTLLDFKSTGNTTNLTCQNKNDRFTVSSANGNGKLTYPVGTVTRQELTLAYYSNNSPINNNISGWTLSPSRTSQRTTYIYYISSSYYGDAMDGSSLTSRGVQPAVSLKAGIEYKTGDGTSLNPFVIIAS